MATRGLIMQGTISIWIDGQPPRKSNSRQIVINRRTGKPFSIKSAEARRWVQDAILQIPAKDKRAVGSQDSPIAITFTVVYSSRRPDLSTELVLDMLEEAGVISNDRHVYERHSYKLFDKDNPGVGIAIQAMDGKAGKP
jgi:Holliday junction resolvase RusA-like endonuclease